MICDRCQPITPDLPTKDYIMSASPATSSDIIALLVASYGRNVPTASDISTSPAPSKLKVVKAAKEKAKSDDGAVAAPKSDKVVTTAILPEAGTLSAKDYIIAMRRARDLNDRIAAIAGYVGFSRTASYSSQELAANMKAQRALRPAPTFPAISGAAVSLRGFVAGVPDAAAKRLADLQGRETLAAETLADHERAASVAMSDEERHYHTQMARVERERLDQIKADLAAC
jgi:hypothetical protein